MPARDIYHNNVKNALIKDGWTITHDPLRLSWGSEEKKNRESMQKNDKSSPEKNNHSLANSAREKWKYASLSWQLPLLGLILCIIGITTRIIDTVAVLLFLGSLCVGVVFTIQDFVHIRKYKNCVSHAIGGLLINLTFIVGTIAILLYFIAIFQD